MADGRHPWARLPRSAPLPLQALLPEELRRAVPELTETEARVVISTVHRDKDPFAANSRVRRVAREA